MGRLRSTDVTGVWVGNPDSEPMPGDRSKNGPYRGLLPVRTLPAGVSGEDLRAARQEPARGQLWRRGPVLVRVVQVTRLHVTFRELNYAKNQRRVRRCDFVRTALRKAAL